MRTKFAAAMVIGLAVLVGAAFVVAQQPPSVRVGQAFDVLANHDGLNTESYLLAITGASTYGANLPVSALSGGVITFTVPGLTNAGNHTITVTAVGPGGQTSSDPFAFSVVAVVPVKPASLRIVPR